MYKFSTIVYTVSLKILKDYPSMKNKSTLLYLILSILTLVSCFIANNIALWIGSITAIGASAFLLFDLN